MHTLTVADIYCGAGGLSAGFSSAFVNLRNGDFAKFEIVFGVDKDRDAIKTFRHYHFDDLSEEELEIVAPASDIANITAEMIMNAVRHRGYQELDVIIGGPNCQGVSAAGLRNPDDKRNDMFTRFKDFVSELKPQWFVMENVPGLTHENNRELLHTIFEQFEGIQDYTYEVQGDVLLAADYGVPQFRYRLFIVGTRTGKPILFPSSTYFEPHIENGELVFGSNSYVTTRLAIEDLSKIAIATNGTREAISNHCGTNISEENMVRISEIPRGGDWRNIPIRYLPERNFATRASDQKGSYGRLLWDWPAYTITNAVANVTAGPFIHPEQNRALSVREAARIQSFEDEHIFFGKVNSQYKQVGNAVPPLMAEALAQIILLSHFESQVQEGLGYKGPLNKQVLKDSLDGKREFPVLTERKTYPLDANLEERRSIPKPRNAQNNTLLQSIWDKEPRSNYDPFPDYTKKLRVLAKQPGNYRAAKRARAIISFIDGVDKREILKNASASERSVKKWVDGYYSEGINGWRAYHTPLERISNNDLLLKARLKVKINRVRIFELEPHLNGTSNGKPHRRLHMNDYLVQLKERYGEKSVAELITLVQETLGYSIGTVYVDDLLAIADEVIGEI